MYPLKAHRTAITVFILSMNHVIRGGEFPPDELVENVGGVSFDSWTQ